MGIEGGLLGLDITDDRLKSTDLIAEKSGINITYEIGTFETKHPNSVLLVLEGINGKKIQVLAASLGGGAFEIQEINGIKVDLRGNYFELLANSKSNNLPENIKAIIPKEAVVSVLSGKSNNLINIKSSAEFDHTFIEQLNSHPDINNVVVVSPVLPIVSGNETEPPFTTIDSLLEYAEKEKFDLGQLGIIYERSLSDLSEQELFDKMNQIIGIIENSIAKGLKGTEYRDRILHHQSHLIEKAAGENKILPNTILNEIIANVTSIMEAKSAMEVVVANPTAGSCGTVGGTLKAVANTLKSSPEELVKAYFAAGLIGAYFAQGPGFSAEEHGCQVECGAASGMAAAAIVQLFGGTAKQAIDAASMAIQNMIGLICDPVADRVEVPCLGKNISAAVNALSSATMACAGFDAVIPFDEVLDTVSRVSKQMPTCVKCTGKGGLAITNTAIELKENLARE
jgi:L-serine dehydratase